MLSDGFEIERLTYVPGPFLRESFLEAILAKTSELRTNRVPRNWPRSMKSGLLHVISLARLALLHMRGWAATSRDARMQQQFELDRLRTEVELLQ